MLTLRQTSKDVARLITPPILVDCYRRVRQRVRPAVGQAQEWPAEVETAAPLALPVRELREMFPGVDQATVSLPVSQVERHAGMLPLPELLTLAALCRHLAPR